MDGVFDFESLNFYAISGAVNTAVSLVFGLYVFLSAPRSYVNRSFWYFTLSVALWSYGYYHWQMANTAVDARLWIGVLMLGAILIVPTFFNFIASTINKQTAWGYWIIACFAAFSPFLFLVFNDQFVAGLRPIVGFEFWPIAGLWLHCFLVLWFGTLVSLTTLVVQHYKHEPVGHRSNNALVMLAIIILIINGSINYLPWYGIAVPPVTTILISLYVVVIGKSIISYGLFSRRVLITELIALSLLTAFTIRTLLSYSTKDFVFNSILLLFVITGTSLLVRSARRETAQLIKIEQLAKRLECSNKKLQKLDKMKSEFVSIASHQLRTPLTVIRGYASLLREGSFGKIPKAALEPVTRIEESSKLMAEEISDYLNISRIETGNLKYYYRDFNLPETVEQIADELRPSALQVGLVLWFRSNLNTKGIVNADRGKVTQIVQNLITNAIKYTKSGTITVFVRDDIKRNKINIDIIDTGIGIPPEAIDKIFDKFSRVGDGSQINTAGSGLGLYVAKLMAEAMNGNISAYSDGIGKGSRFTFTLPLEL